MANRVPVKLPPGLKSDDTSYSTQGFWRKADKMRFVEDRAEIIKGWERISQDKIPGTVRNLLPWRDNLQSPNIAIGSNAVLYVWKGGVVYNITPVDYIVASTSGSTAPGFGLGDFGLGPFGTYTGKGNFRTKTWSFSTLGQSLIATPRLGPIYWWKNDVNVPAQRLADISDALTASGLAGSAKVPEHVHTSIVTDNRQILVGGCEEVGSVDNVLGPYNPLCIRGTELGGDINVWIPDRTNNAFEYVLPDGGYIVVMLRWGQEIGIFNDDNVYRATYTGDPILPYRFEPMPGSVGVVGPNAATIVGSTAYWISRDYQLWACPQGGAPAMIESPIHNTTLARMVTSSQGDKIVLTHIISNNELRIDYPHPDDGIENSRYVSYHMGSGAWSTGIMSRTAFDRGVEFPLGADSGTELRGSPVSVVNNNTAVLALTLAQSNIPEIAGENAVLRSNATVTDHVAVQDIAGTDSGWGFVFVGNGVSVTYGEISHVTTANSVPISVSFDAQIKSGPPEVLATVEVYHTASGHQTIETQNFVLQRNDARYEMENVQLPVNASNVVVRIGVVSPVLTNGTTLNVWDIKVEERQTSTEWTPNPHDPNIYDLYAPFIRDLKYNQTVSKFYYHERGGNADGGPIVWSIETNDFTLDDAFTAFQVSRFIPDFIGQTGSVVVTIYSRMSPQDQNERVYGPFTILPGQDKIDMRGLGKIFRFKFSGSGTPANLRIGQPMFEITPAGRR